MVSASKGVVLVVDDNEMNRDVLSRRLTRRNYTVAVAEGGQQALDMIETGQFDLVLLDIMMPGISGFDVLKRLREHRSATALPVIMATAKDQSEDIVEALKLGANDYVTKPLDFPVVLARVETQLALKRAMEDVQRLAGQLEARNQFIRDVFGRYLTDEVVDNLLDSPEGLQLGGEQRKVTMLMSDLRGFTALASRLAPQQVVTILNRYLGAMAEVITQYGGTIDEFIGDAIFVIFGAPIVREDDAPRAVACAVAMQVTMASVNQQNQRDGLPDLEMGIGVHTGEVVVGNIGSDRRAKYGVVGSHVNLTARIESYTVGGQVLISEATRQELGPLLEVDEQIKIEAKGIDQPISIYNIRGIGEPYHLWLPDVKEHVVRLPQMIPMQGAFVEGNHAEQMTFTGQFVTLSAKGGEVHTDVPIALWSNLKIQLAVPNREDISGFLYAKVLSHPSENHSEFYLHFTSVPPDIMTFFQRLLASHLP